ncbi:MAG: 4Fe-4S dicluster domain-containing protein [Bacteroidales bacterium]|nr:4Fe-4S dicluster domain-containing protein [Bacteroidales bacterium]
MIEFGYSLQTNRQIDVDIKNLRLLKYVRKNEPSVDWCMSCGTCASGCTAGESTDFSLRSMILMARRGEEDELMTSIFRCRFCGKCLNACPRGVNTRNVIYWMQQAVKNINAL